MNAIDPSASFALETGPALSPKTDGAARWACRVLPFLVPLAILLLWQWTGRGQWVPAQVLPGPNAVLLALRDAVATGELQTNLMRTLLWLLEGFAIAALLGVGLGIAVGLSPRFEDYVYPTFKAVSYVPVIGWLPLWLVLLGVGDVLKVVLVTQAALSPIVFNVHDGIRGVPATSIELGRVLTFTRVQQLRWIILPSAFPAIWSGIRFGLTKAWLALVAVELLASAEGLGFMMVNARNLYQLDMMFVSVLAIGAVGLALDRGLHAIETRVLAWRETEDNR